MTADAASPAGAIILIVDDDSGAVEAFGHMLRACGYQVRVAGDGPSALREVERDAPAAALVDLHLPGSDGLTVLRQLRASARHARLPVAVMTGNYLVDDAVAGELQELGAALYFKPIWEEDLAAIVRSLLDNA